MSDIQTSATPERNLLDEIEELNVLEAEELQEGVAFHAFRFAEANPMNLLDVILNDRAEGLVDKLSLPQGATLMTVQDNVMRIAYDETTVSSQDLDQRVRGALGKSVADVRTDDATKYELTKVPK